MIRVRVVAAAAVLSMLAVVTPAFASVAGSGSGETVDVIVVLDGAGAPGGQAANQRGAAEVARSHGLQPSHTYGSALFGFAASVPEGRLGALEQDPRVSTVQEDGVMHALGDPTGVRRVDADDVRATVPTGGPSGAGITVAILDTGIAAEHPDLPNLGEGKSCIENEPTTDDAHGHGTHVAGTVGASLASSVTGVAPDVTLLPVKVLPASGEGKWSEVICGIDWVTAQNRDGRRVHVANMSLGAQGSYTYEVCNTGGDALYDALCKAIDSGTTFTIAAGNDGLDASGFIPAAHPRVVTVSAYSDTDGQANRITSCSRLLFWKTCDESFAGFSNHGAAVDVMAPGVDIESTTKDGKTGAMSGTSMAAPHVAGVVALVLEASPAMSPDDVERHLKATGQCPNTAQAPDSGACAGTWRNDPDGFTEPLVNAGFAVQGLGGGGDGDGDVEPPTDTSGKVWVSDLDGTATNLGSMWSPKVTVGVSNSGGVVAGAIVTGSWGSGDAVSCTTDEAGSCSIEGPAQKKKVASVTFTVSNVKADNLTLTYDAALNTDPDGDSDGTTITVSKS